MVLRSLGTPPPFLHIPLWATRLLTLVMPVWGAWIGKLTIFQVIWVYWVEAWIVIPFLLIRIAAARGPYTPGMAGAPEEATNADLSAFGPPRTATVWERLRMMANMIIIRGLLLLFYLVFIILFIFLQVTEQGDSMMAGVRTMVFRDPWANGIWAAFIFQHTIEIIAHFFYDGSWRAARPREATSFLDPSTLVMHILIVSTVFIHKFFFADEPYAAKGEVVYVALFGLLRLGIDSAANRFAPEKEKRDPLPQPMEG